MSRADALESDLFESLRSRSILVRHGVSPVAVSRVR
jgi:hypothetical protein